MTCRLKHPLWKGHQTTKGKARKQIIFSPPVVSLENWQSYYLKVTNMLISINNTSTTQFKLWQVIDDVCIEAHTDSDSKKPTQLHHSRIQSELIIVCSVSGILIQKDLLGVNLLCF